MDAIKLLTSLLGRNPTGGGLLGSLLKGSNGGGQQRGGSGLVGSLLKGAFGGGGRSRGGSLLGSLMGGGAGGLLSGLLGGGLGGGSKQSPEGGLSGMFGLVSGGSDESSTTAIAPSQEEQATLLIRAMCNAAKADGHIDAAEQQELISLVATARAVLDS